METIMRRSASEIINNLEVRIARLERKSSNPNDLKLALAIKKHIEEYLGGDVQEELQHDPSILTLEEIEQEHPRLEKTINNWERRGLTSSESGVVERKSQGGFHLYDEDWDIRVLNKKGAYLVLRLLGY